MADLIPKHRAQLNGHYRKASSPDRSLTQPESKPLSQPQAPDEIASIQENETSKKNPAPRDANLLERLVLVIAVMLLFIAAVNTGIAIYRFEHQDSQEFGQ